MKPNLTTVFKPNLVEANNNQTQIKNLQEDVAKLTPKIEENKSDNFLESVKNAIDQVSESQVKSAELTKNYELGLENDLTKVMINQQLAGLCSCASQRPCPPAEAVRSVRSGHGAEAMACWNPSRPSTARVEPSGRSEATSPFRSSRWATTSGNCNQC